MANISNPFCFDIVSTVIYVRITISRLDSKFVKIPHCLNHKCMWVLWKLSRQGSTWKNMEGRSIILYLSFSICSGRQTFVQTSFTEGIICVPHCVSHMNTHGSLKVTVLCFALECTRLIKCYIDTCRCVWCTFARLLIHEERIVILFYTVFQTWTHLGHWRCLCCASIMNTQDFLKLTLLCFELECTWLLKLTLQYVFQSEHTWT